MLGSDLADRAAGLVHDEARVRWTDTDWLAWINDAQREVVSLKPDAHVVSAPVALTAGVTRQSLPSSGVRLVAVMRNMGDDGNTPGHAISLAAREHLDLVEPNWHSASGSRIKHYLYDPRDPLHFFVYPKAPASPWYVEMVYSALPADLSALSDPLALHDIYANAVLSYLLHRAYLRDAEYAQNAQLAAMHYSAFSSALGVNSLASAASNPNLTTGAFAPEPIGSAGKPQ